MKKLLPIFFLLLSLHAHAQTWQWGRTPNDFGSSVTGGGPIAHDRQGNVYVIGGYYGNPAFGSYTLAYHNVSFGSALYLVKYDSLGNVLWARNSIDSSVDPTSIAVDNAGNVYITGTFSNSYLTFGAYTLTEAYNSISLFLVKYDSSGNVLWQKQRLVQTRPIFKVHRLQQMRQVIFTLQAFLPVAC